MSELFKHFGSLFEAFHWWSLLLIACVIVIMVPINFALKKALNKASVARIRKTIAFVSVYIISAGVVALFTVLSTDILITANYLIGSALALGFCSQFGWEMIKLIRDYGIKKFAAWLISKIDEDKAVSGISEKYSIDKSLVKILVKEVKSKMSEETDEIERAFKEDTEIITALHEKVAAIANSEDVDVVVNEIYKLVK